MKGLLKFLTCGSVDDGKSTLIGHMLYDAKLLYADQKQALELESKVGSSDGAIDYALLMDGLIAEREQGITIDVAYRYFTTDHRSFIVADTPGHEEYTRNMAVGASFADLSVILVDATKGILPQTRRHAMICALMGIQHFVFAINKMDLIHYDEHQFHQIENSIRKLVIDLNLQFVKIIPVSATEGANVNHTSPAMPWYKEETLLEYLENVDIEQETEEEGFVLPIQRVCRPNRTFRGFQGQVESGTVSIGDEITVMPSGEKAHVSELLNADHSVDTVKKGQAVTICLDREIDLSRGSVMVKDTQLKKQDMFEATLLWMDDQKLVEGKSILLKLGTKMIPAYIMRVKHRLDINNGSRIHTKQVYKNEIAVCEIVTSEKIVFDLFSNHRALGRFIMIDRITNMTSACGVVDKEINRSDYLFWHEMDITRETRANMMGQKPVTLWFTGLSGAGKSTLANAIEKKLSLEGRHTMLLDGDNIRMGINKDLGFSDEDRTENIRRVAEIAKLMNDAGLIVLTSFISPFRLERENAKALIGSDTFIEIYVATSAQECEKRDVKGLYKKARNGELAQFTGYSSAYEPPEHADIEVVTDGKTIEECAEYIYEELKKVMGES